VGAVPFQLGEGGCLESVLNEHLLVTGASAADMPCHRTAIVSCSPGAVDFIVGWFLNPVQALLARLDKAGARG
jgi:hypothetical protein